MKTGKTPLGLHKVREHRRDDCFFYNACLKQAALLPDAATFSCKGCVNYKKSSARQPDRLGRVFGPNASDMWG